MLPVLSRPLSEIGVADIQSLIDEEVPEGEQIEFKREPPAPKGETDRWMTRGDKISNYAKKEILEEVVAFANAYGGVLLIGIEESKKKPSVATKIFPVPRCADLADRLKSVFRDGVDPQFTRIEIKGIPTEDDESGVVILRVGGRSRLAPHRVKKTLSCPIRRGDQCQEMGMREIQDMTLNVSRGLERLDKRLSERSKRFREEFDRLSDPDSAFGIRFTAVPVVDEIGFDRVFESQFPGPGRVVENLDMQWCGVVQDPKHKKRELEQNYGVSDLPRGFWQPLLRGARVTASRPRENDLPRSVYGEIYCDGLLELGYVSNARYYRLNTPKDNFLDPDLPIVMFANLAVWADHIRKQAGAPTVEYALEVETYNRGSAGLVTKGMEYGSGDFPTLRDKKFYKYPLNDRDGIAELLTLFYRDFWNSMGEDWGDEDFVLG